MTVDPALFGPFAVLLVLTLLGDGLRPGRDGIPALLAFGAASYGACAARLEGLTIALALLMALALFLGVRAGASRGRLLAQGAVCAGSLGALGVGLMGRFANAGGGRDVEWIGTPFVGDGPSSWIFVGLALPLVLPGALGGASAGFDGALGGRKGEALRAGEPRSSTALAAAGALLPMALAMALFRTFAGSAPLSAVGGLAALTALLEVVAVGRFRVQAALRALTAGSVGLQVLALAEVSGAAESAFFLGMLALALGLGGALVAVSRLSAGPIGGGSAVLRVAPVGSVLGAVSLASIGAMPLTLGFVARARTLGGAAGELPQEVLLAVALQGPLFALCALPLLVHVLRSAAPRIGEGRGARAALGIAAVGTVGLGVAPDAALAWLGQGSPGRAASLFPGAMGQLSLLAASAALGLLAWRRVGPASPIDGERSTGGHSPTPVGYPPRP